MSDEPDFSVLLPLQEDRDAGLQSIRAWSLEQTLPRERYELIVLAPGLDRELERGARRLIGPRDRWIEHASPSEWELFNVGAAAARGRFLFVTEVHCVPEPACLEEMLAHLEATQQPGARGRSVGVSEGALGRIEQLVYEEDLSVGEDPDHWRKVLIHSLAIRRDVYAQVGGFAPRYGDYAGWALSVALREAGYRLGATPGAPVRHRYTGELGILAEHVRDFARGEMRWCAETPADVRDRYVSEPEEWTERWTYSRDGARQALRATLATRHVDRAVLRAVAGHAAVAAVGPGAAVWTARAGVAVQRAHVWLTSRHGARALPAYRRHWELCSRLGRREYLAAHPPAAVEQQDAPTPEVDLVTARGIRCVGLHARERWCDVEFRWTAPLAVFEVSLPPGRRFDARLELAPLRPPEPAPDVRIAVDGRRAPMTLDASGVRFPVNGGRRVIGLTCSPLRPRGADPRDLGLPVRRLSFAAA